MNKQSIVNQILAKLDAELARYELAAREAAAGATDEQSKAENKYDTRGLEASYLAAGQSRQALEIAKGRGQLAKLVLRDFEPDEGAGAGALVAVRSGEEEFWCFLSPAAGGTEVSSVGREILVITPQSPIGRAVWGKRKGEQAAGFLVVEVR